MIDFRAELKAAESRLRRLPEASTGEFYPGGTWTRKEVLGHLIDSALNNHQRFVRAALQGHYDGPGYAQEGWVEMHGYREMAWGDLLEHWRRQNELLARVVERIPASRSGASCVVGDGAAVPLAFLIDDYINHLKGHLDQIEKGW
jgi:hypothetical protein